MIARSGEIFSVSKIGKTKYVATDHVNSHKKFFAILVENQLSIQNCNKRITVPTVIITIIHVINLKKCVNIVLNPTPNEYVSLLSIFIVQVMSAALNKKEIKFNINNNNKNPAMVSANTFPVMGSLSHASASICAIGMMPTLNTASEIMTRNIGKSSSTLFFFKITQFCWSIRTPSFHFVQIELYRILREFGKMCL